MLCDAFDVINHWDRAAERDDTPGRPEAKFRSPADSARRTCIE